MGAAETVTDLDCPQPPTTRVAVVDEDPTNRRLIGHWLQQAPCLSSEAASIAQLPSPGDSYATLLINWRVAQEGDGDLLEKVRPFAPAALVIVYGGPNTVEAGVSVMRAGAFDYLSQPIESSQILTAVSRAERQHRITGRARELQGNLEERALSGPLLGHCPAIVELDRAVQKVLFRDVVVSLLAEDGAGEELVARAIHQGGARGVGPFFELDCSSHNATEQAELLFGRSQAEGAGAFGLCEQANGGTLFLRQVDALAPAVQETLARTLSSKTFRSSRDGREIPLSVRLVVASQKPLRELADAGQLRQDLFFRLSVYPLKVPSLRERTDDIPWIASQFIKTLDANSRHQFSPDALKALMRYSWPGNLRQLEHMVHRALLHASGDVIEWSDLPAELQGVAPSGSVQDWQSVLVFPEDQVVPLRDLEKLAIEHALRVTGGSVSAAAQKLGIGRATLYRRLASFEVASRDVA